MAATRLDLVMERRAGFVLPLDFYNPDDTPQDLSGLTSVTMKVKEGNLDHPGAERLSLTMANGRVVVAGNRITLQVTKADIKANLTVGSYVYDLEMVFDVTDPSKDVSPIYGVVKVVEEVSS